MTTSYRTLRGDNMRLAAAKPWWSYAQPRGGKKTVAMAADLGLGPITLLGSGRLARKVATNRSDQSVFIDSEGQTCCSHGERAPSIQAWIAAERKDATFKRPSLCTCQNVDGLLTTYAAAKAPWPSSGASLFKLLGVLGAKELSNNTRPQRLALTTHTGCEVWIQPTGTLVCKHGNTRKLLHKMKRSTATHFRSSRVVVCNCTLSVPRRNGTVFSPFKKTS